VRQLEQELQATKSKLDDRESELQKTKDELARVTRDKDAQIAQLNTKLQNMGTAYEVMLQEIFDALYAKVQATKANWHTRTTQLIARNKQALLEFGLNPLQL
jgi:predicted nuclease with TOPRIM domain